MFKCLDDLESRINPEEENALYLSWVDFLEGRYPHALFMPSRKETYPAKYKWPKVSVNQAIDEYEKMAISQFAMCSDLLAQGSGGMMGVRSNYGTGILATLFGTKIYMMEEHMETLPTVWPLDSIDVIKRVVDAGVPDLYNSYGGHALEMAEIYAELLTDYPKISRFVHLYHPDLQGPMDICELLCGSKIFTYIYDYPDLIHALLELITDTYIQFLNKWYQIIPPTEKYSVHWWFMHKGLIMLRDDSAMNFSPAMVDEFVLPYDQRLLNEFNGGAIHFCGKGDHYIESMCNMDQLHCIHMSQPEYNDIEMILANTVDKGIKILEFPEELAVSLCNEGRQFSGNMHCKPSSVE